MAIVNGSLQVGYKDSAWFTANPTVVLKEGQIVYLEQTGTYKLGDGVTQLSALTFLGGGGTVDVNTIGSAINGATSATPNDTDLVMSVESSVAKKNTWTQIKAFLKTYFDTVYATITDLTGYVKKGTLTTNYIPKATASDTIGDGQILDDGVNGIQLNRYVKNAAATTNYLDLFYNTGSALLSNVQTEMLAPICQMSSASDHYARLESTGRKVLLRGDLLSFYQSSNAVGVVFDLEHGTGGNINDTIAYFYSASGNTYLGIGKTVPTEALDVVGNVVISGLTASQLVATDANKKLVSYSKTDLKNFVGEYEMYMTTGNQSTTSSASSNITDLVSSTLTINKRYQIHGRIKVGCNNTGGVKFQITLPTGASMDVSLSGSNTSNTTYINTTITTSATLSASVQSFNGSSILRIDGEITMGATAGTIQFGFASGTNTQTSTVYQQGTSITLKQLD